MDGRGSNRARAHLKRLGLSTRAMRCSRDCAPGECGSRMNDRHGVHARNGGSMLRALGGMPRRADSQLAAYLSIKLY